MQVHQELSSTLTASSWIPRTEANFHNVWEHDKPQISTPSRADSSTTKDDLQSQMNRELLASAGLPNGSTADNDVKVKIVGGTPVASEDDFPFFVVSGSSSLCGASLIAPDIVMSAAHCGDRAFSQGLYVGGLHIVRPYDGEFFKVDEIVIYPGYVGSPWYQHDLMIIKLLTPSAAEPVTLNFDENVPYDGEMLTVIGHGTTSEGGDVSYDLLQVDLPYVNKYECYSSLYVPPDTSICAGGVVGYDSCQGDSGGPLFTTDKVQVGIVSVGFGCANESPGIYTRISNYADWITSTACSLTRTTSALCGTLSPTGEPSSPPTMFPTGAPSHRPTRVPTVEPTHRPTSTAYPTGPTLGPSWVSSMPSISNSPTGAPSPVASTQPSEAEDSPVAGPVTTTSLFEMVLSGVPLNTLMTPMQAAYLTEMIGEFLEGRIPVFEAPVIVITQQAPLYDIHDVHTDGRSLREGKLGLAGSITAAHQADLTSEEFADLIDETINIGEDELITGISQGFANSEYSQSHQDELAFFSSLFEIDSEVHAIDEAAATVREDDDMPEGILGLEEILGLEIHVVVGACVVFVAVAVFVFLCCIGVQKLLKK